MTPTMGKSVFVVLAVLCGVSLAQLHTYQEKCGVGKTNDNRELDTCDPQKFLKCRDSRCQCADAANQIWTYAYVPVNSRVRRGKGGKSKGGFGKGVAIGAGAGAIGGFVAGRATAGSGSSSSSSGSSSSRPGNSVKKTKEYSCYSRVGGSCLLNNNGAIVSIIKTQEVTTTTTTTAAPASNATNDTTPSTTSAPAPVAAAQVYDVINLPKCVENAVCRPIQVKIVNGTVVAGGNAGDPRVGACLCADGYKANNQDICVRTNGAGRPSEAAFILTAMCLAASLIRKYY